MGERLERLVELRGVPSQRKVGSLIILRTLKESLWPGI